MRRRRPNLVAGAAALKASEQDHQDDDQEDEAADTDIHVSLLYLGLLWKPLSKVRSSGFCAVIESRVN